MRSRTKVAALVLCALSPLPALSQQAPAETPPSRPEVLVLGVYHMANPGQDVVNMEADDVLAPGRQAEIAELVGVLEGFQPTKIAVEADFNNDAVAARYEEYLAGERELSRNETQQIGFRLARRLDHDAVHPVDVDGEFPLPRLRDYVKAHDRTEEFGALVGEIQSFVEATDDHLASHTVLETLLFMNSEDRVEKSVGFYYRQARFGEPWNWAGADLVSAWFERNIRIFSNVINLIESPDERVLVIFGAGHLGWLRESFASDPTVQLRKLAEFVQ